MTDEERRRVVMRDIEVIEAEMRALRAKLMKLIQEYQRLRRHSAQALEPDWGGPEIVITETGE